MIRRWIAALLFIAAFTIGLVAAQGNGQLCISAFEDRNGNGQEDPNEPRISQFLDATLQDGNGIIISTLAMKNSPTAASGRLCFQRLDAGQYTISIRSAKYTPTTEDRFITSVSGTGVAQNFSFGGQLIPSQQVTSAENDSAQISLSRNEQEALLRRLFVAGIGAAIVLGAMAVVGAFIAFFFIRSRRPPAVPFADSRYSTGQFRPQTDNVAQPIVNSPLPMVDIYDDSEPIPLDKPDNFMDSFRFTEDAVAEDEVTEDDLLDETDKPMDADE